MPATLGNAGLAVQTQAEILAEIQAELLDPTTGLGPLHDVTSATSPIAVLAGLAARREAQYQSLLSSLSSALYPAGAAGTMLDRQATITGASERIEESHSTIKVRASGTIGTDVSNKLIRYVPTQTLWRMPGLAILDGTGNFIGTARAEDPGPLDADASTAWEIVSTTNGWNLVLSIEDAEAGELEEDDPTFRDRLANTDSVGRGTEPAIYARLLEVPGVTSIVVDNNRGLVPNVNGVPGKTVESLVIGGEDAVIAEVLHETYECDSGSFGNTTVDFINRFGKPITIQFSRIDEVQCFVHVFITAGGEVPLPADYAAQVRQAIGARAAQLKPGQDLTSAWFIGAIVDALPANSVVDSNLVFSFEELGSYTATLPLTSRQLGLLANAPVPAQIKSLQKPAGFNVTAGWHLDFKINGGATHVVAFSGGSAMTGQQLAAEVQADLTFTDEDAAAFGSLNRLRIATTDGGASKTIQILNTSTSGLMAELGGDFAVATTYTGAAASVFAITVV